MSNFGYPNTSGAGPSPDFYSFQFQASSSNNSNPSEPNYYAPPSRYGGGGTFQTIYGSFNSRMRRISDFEPVKHKRSRKGCFTCRARRVKCDEVRPRCHRCRKGKRACVFPEEPPSPLEGSGKSTADDRQPSGEPSASSHEATAGDEARKGSRGKGHASVSSASSHEMVSPSDNESSSSALPQQEKKGRTGSTLPDVKSYLDFFSNHVSHHHYGFLEPDKGSYLRSQLADYAAKDDALMYAIVAFSAYLVMVSRGEPSMEEFLGFYSSSMYMLRRSLQGSDGQRLSVTTLMTVLQLALLEEYLGDWVNLQAHKRAALSLIMEMYTPTSMVEDPLPRILLEWYTRFDQFTAFMAKSRNSLSREWFQASCSPPHNMETSVDGPTMLRINSEMSLRLLGKDVSTFFGSIETGASGASNPTPDISPLVSRFEQWTNESGRYLLDQAQMKRRSIGEDSKLPQSSNTPQETDSGTEDNKNIWPSKHLLVRFWTLELFFNQIASLMRLVTPTLSIASQVRRVCSMLQDIESHDPHPDAIIGISACLALASLASRSDPKWASWCHEKFLIVISRGYLFPSALRKLMPTSSEQSTEAPSATQPVAEHPAVINAIREWIEERSNNQLDSESGSIREMAGIIGSIEMGEE